MSCCCYPPTPILYYDDISPQARSCYMLIKVLGIDVDLRPINLTDGEHLDEAYRQINPSGTVPTFIDGKLALYDSHTIMIYICDKYTCSCLPQLCPQQYIKRMQLLNLLFYEGCVLYRRHSHALTDILLQKYANVDIEYHKSKISDCYRTLDKLLECQSFLIGNSISIADFSVISTVGALDIMFPINADLWPNLYNWLMRLKCTSWYPYNEDGIQKQKELLATVGEFPFPSPIVLDPNIPIRSSFQWNNEQNPNEELVSESGIGNIDENAKQTAARDIGGFGEIKQMNCLCMQNVFNEVKQMLKLQSKQFDNIMDNGHVCSNKGNLKRTSYSETDFNERAYKCLEYECLFKRKGNVVEANLKKCENTLNANEFKNAYLTLPANNKANTESYPNDTGKAKFAICDKNTCPSFNNDERQNLISNNYTNTTELKPYKSCICFNTNLPNWNSYSDDNFIDSGGPCDRNCNCCATADDTNYQNNIIDKYEQNCTCRIDDNCLDDVNEYQCADEIVMDNTRYCDEWPTTANTRNQLANDGAICQCRNIETNTDNYCDSPKVSDEGVCFILLKRPNSTNTNNNNNNCCCKCCCNEINVINQKLSSKSSSDGADCAQKLIKLCFCDAASEANDYEKECLLCMCNLIEKIAFKRNCDDEAPSACCCDAVNSANAASLKQNACTCGEKTTKEEEARKEDDNKTEAGKASKKGTVKRSKSLEFPRKSEKSEQQSRPSENQSKVAKEQKASKAARNSTANSPLKNGDVKAKADNLDETSNEKIPPGMKFCCCCKNTSFCEKANNNINIFDNHCEPVNRRLNVCTCVKKNQNLEKEAMDDSNTNTNDKLKSSARGSAIKAKSPNQREDRNKGSAVRNESSMDINTMKSPRSNPANSKNQKPPPAKNNEPVQQTRLSMNPSNNNDRNNENANGKFTCDKTFPKRNTPNMYVKTVSKCCCKRDADRSASGKCRLRAGSIDKTLQIPSKPCNDEFNKKVSPNKLSINSTSGQSKPNKNISPVKGSGESSKGSNKENHFEKNCSNNNANTVPVNVDGHICSKDNNDKCRQNQLEKQRSALLSKKVHKSNAKTSEGTMACKCRKCLLKSIFNDTSTVNQCHHPVCGKNGPNLAKHTSSKTSNCLYYRNNTTGTKEINKRTVKKSLDFNGPKPKTINKFNRNLPKKTDMKYYGSTRTHSSSGILRKTILPTPTPNPSFTSLTSTGNGCKYRNFSQNTSNTSIAEKHQVQFSNAVGIIKKTSFKSNIPIRIKCKSNLSNNISNEKFQYFPTIRVKRKQRKQRKLAGKISKPKNSKLKNTKTRYDAKLGTDDNKIANISSSIRTQTNGNIADKPNYKKFQSKLDCGLEESTSSIVISATNEILHLQKSIIEKSKDSTAFQKFENNVKPPIQSRQPIKFEKTLKCLMEFNRNKFQIGNKTSISTKSHQDKDSTSNGKSEMLAVKSISTRSATKPLSKLSRAKLYDKNRMAAVMKTKSSSLRNIVIPSKCNMEKKCSNTKNPQTVRNSFYSAATNITLPKQLNKPIIFNSEKSIKTSKGPTNT